MVRQFHDGMLAWVQNDGEFSDPFPVTNGVKQGCVIAPALFSMMFSAMLTAAFQDGDNGTFVRFVLVWICRFPLPFGVWEGLLVVIVALPGLFSYLLFYTY